MKNIKEFLKRIYLFPLNTLMGVTTTAVVGTAATPYRGMGKVFVTEPNTVSVPKTGITNDIVQAVPCLAGWLVEGVLVQMLTIGTPTTCTLCIGITGGTTNGFVTNFDGTAAGPFLSPLANTYPAAGGYLFASTGTIDVLLQTISVMTVGPIMSIQAYGIDLNQP